MHTPHAISAAPGLPTVLVLASGRGRRFNASGGQGDKLQADLLGMTVLARTLAAVQASGLPWHLEADAHSGMGDSIAAAVRATRSSSGWLVLPADLPLVMPQTLWQLAQLDVTAEVLVPMFEGQRGHPVRFAPVCGDALAALRGPQGAASVIARFRSVRWSVTDRGCVTDIDTLADLERARALLRSNIRLAEAGTATGFASKVRVDLGQDSK